MRLFRILTAAVALLLAAFALLAGNAPGQIFVTWPQPVNLGAATDLTDDATPALVRTASGHVVAAWRSDGSAAGTPVNEIVVSRSGDWGGSWSTPQSLGGLLCPGWSGEGHPAIAADSSSRVIVTWQRGDTLLCWQPTNVVIVRSTDDGQTWAPTTDLTNATSWIDPQHKNPSIATDGIGCWIIAFESSDSLGATIGTDLDIFFARSTDHGVNWATASLNSDAASDTTTDMFPKIATDGAGHWIVAWEKDQRHLYIARSSDNGLSWSPVQNLWTEPPLSWFSIDLAFEPTFGQWLLTWVSNSDILLSRSGDHGVSWSPPQSIAGSGAPLDHGPTIATGSGQPALLMWHTRDASNTRDHLRTARSADGGLMWSAPADLISNPAFNQGDSRNPSLASDAQGNWMCAWDFAFAPAGPDLDILFSRGVGPSPSASLTISATNPTPMSYQICATNMGFTPGRTFFTCLTLEAGAYPVGNWFGIDPLQGELLAQVTTPAPPFNGTFDAAGNSAFTLTFWSTPGPLAVTLRAVTLEHIGGAILRASPPIEAFL